MIGGPHSFHLVSVLKTFLRRKDAPQLGLLYILGAAADMAVSMNKDESNFSSRDRSSKRNT